jgi:O-methyltransferase domain/Dimerisation domain
MDAARRKLLGVLSGSWLAQACYAMVKLDVPDLLAAGPRTVEDLAAASGADARVLYRLLRALASAGLLRQPSPGEFALNPVSELLRSGVPGSARGAALTQGEEVFRSFAEIMHTVRTGTPAFDKVYGQPFYAYLDANPEVAREFADGMGGQPVPAGLSTCDFTGVGTLVDVGGGTGALLADVLARYPAMRGVLLERPEALRQARSRLSDVDGRVEFVAGSFFGAVPPGGDVYVLARVLHNWADERAADIVRAVRAAAAPGARLVVLEEFADGPGPGLVDLLMLVTLEGYERTAAEYRELLTAGGFGVTDTRPGVVEARA